MVTEPLFDLGRFDLSDMIECGRAVRDASEGAGSMEASACALVKMFYERLVSRETGERNCALVRCFKTHRFRNLPDDLAEIARGVLRGREPEPEMPALTLLATAGDEAAWNDRRGSRGHAAIPLESVAMVERAPMIAALLGQMGLKIDSAMNPTAQLILDADQHAFNVFHVERAAGDARIPAQEEFVQPHGIESVLGFGGLLPSGELFAVIMFSRVRIPRATADLFRTIALGVKLALLPFTRGPIFDEERSARALARGTRVDEREGPLGETEEEQLRSEIATLRLLIPALEEAALQQTNRLKGAMGDLRAQGEQMRRQGYRLRAMLEGTTDAVFLLDREWRFTFVNGHAQALIGDGRNLLGANLWEIFPKALETQFGTQYRRAMHDGVNIEFQEYYPAPLDRWFEVHAFPIEEGIAVFFRDITRRLNTEAALRQSEKLAVVGRLAASIAHEINNPLESVTNLLYLARGTVKMDEVQEYLETAERELRRVSVIANQTLRFHRQTTNPHPVDCDELIESVLSMFQGRIVNAGVQVERRDRCAQKVICLEGEIRQVLNNLIGNAIDAMSPRGGRLLIRTRTGWNWTAGRGGVVMTVADTGTGIDAESLKRIFDPFYSTKGIGGTGLGLWVSQEIATRHEGRLRVRSRQGVRSGTVFSLFLPC